MANIFDGIKVIDITNNLAGPLCAQMLGDYGAEVIKIERPGAGDDSRGVAPMSMVSVVVHRRNCWVMFLRHLPSVLG